MTALDVLASQSLFCCPLADVVLRHGMTSASSIVAVFALIFWSFQLAPQALLNYRRRSTDGLSPLLLLSWSLASSLTAVNNVTTKLSPLFIVQPNLFLVFSLTCYAQCFYYPSAVASPATNTTTAGDDSTAVTPTAALKPHSTPLRAALHGSVALLACLAIQLAVSLPLLPLHPSASSASLLVVNLLSLLLFLVAFVPQYVAILRSRSAAGVSLLFLCIDMTGAVLSTVALALTTDFGVVEAVSYIGVFVGDGVIVCLKLCLPSQTTESNVLQSDAIGQQPQRGPEQQQVQPQQQQVDTTEVATVADHVHCMDAVIKGGSGQTTG